MYIAIYIRCDRGSLAMMTESKKKLSCLRFRCKAGGKEQEIIEIIDYLVKLLCVGLICKDDD